MGLKPIGNWLEQYIPGIQSTASNLFGQASETATDLADRAIDELRQQRMDLYGDQRGARFVFPESLEGKSDNKSGDYNINHPFVKITFYTWESQSGDVARQISEGLEFDLTSIKEEIISEIFITIPESSIIENFSHQWSDTLDWSLGLSSLISLGGGVALDAVLKSRSLSTIAPFLQSVGEIAFAAAGVRRNDLHALGYKSLDLRSFSFIFNLIPRNQRETRLIENIRNHIKQITTPDYRGVFVTYPAVCDVAVYGGYNKLLYRTMLSGIKQFNVNYAPAGYMRTFKDGSPIQYTMSLDIQELRRLDKRLIDQG